MEVGQLWVKLGLDKSGFNSGVDEAKGQSTGLGGFIKNAFQFTVGAGMFDLIKNGIKAAWDTSIGYNSQIQQSQAAFTTLLGNGSKAATMLSSLSKMAADTPFELTDLTKASQVLLGFGIDANKIMPDLKMLGDVSMGNKDKLQGLALVYAQVQSQGKLMGQDLLQMINNGFNPLQVISQQTGKSMAQLKDEMSKGGISADMVANAFKGATEKGGLFYGSMDKQSKTFEGQMSTLSDNVKSTLGDVLKFQFENLSNVIMPKAIEMVNKFGDGFKKGGLQGALKAVFPPEIAGTLINIGKGIQSTFGWLESHGPLIKTILVGITAGFVAYKIAVMASTVATQIHGIILAISAVRALGLSGATAALEANEGGATIAQWALNAALNANPIAIIILAVIALVAGIIYLWNTNEGFRKAVTGAWNAIKDAAVSVFTGIKNFFIGIWNWLKNFFGQWGTVILAVLVPFIGIPILIAQHWQQITAFLSGIWNGIKSVAGTVWNGIKTVVMGIVTPFVNVIKTLFSGMGTSIKAIMNGIKTFFSSIWLGIKTAILGPVLLIIDLVTGNFGKLKTDALGIFNNLKKSTEGIWNGLGQFFSGIGKAIYTLLSNAWNSIKNYIVTKGTEILQENVERWNSIINFFKALPGKLLQYIKNAWTNMKQAIIQKGSEILQENVNRWNSILNFLGTLPGKFLSKVRDIGTSIKNGFNSAVNFIKNLPSEALKWGEDFINGLINGIKRSVGKVGDAVKGIGDKIRSFLHFSVPDEGPLKDYETWMPDMIEGMKKGVDDHKGNLISTIKNLAGGMALSVKGSFSSESLAAVTSGNGYNTANIVIELDGKVLARILGQKLVDMIRLKTGVKI